MRFLNLLLVIISLIFPLTAIAIDAPILSSPADSSTTSSSTLNWEAVSGASQYRVIVDDEPAVTAPYIKNYYASRNQYSPRLDNKTYYWKVAAKDSSGSWSEYSPIWSFTLSSSSEATSTQSPSQTPKTSSSTKETATSSFTITDTPDEISSNKSFKVSVTLSSPNNPNTRFFLKGAFKKEGGSNYFGLTKVNSDWVKNGSSYPNQFSTATDSSGNWSGSLEVKPDSEDSGFEGTGDYIFKVAKYSSSGSGPSWSNEVNIHITEVAAIANQTSTASSSTKSNVKVSPKEETGNFKIGSVAGEETMKEEAVSSPIVAGQKEESSTNPLIILGIVLILFGFSFIVYFYLRFKFQGN